MDYLLTVHSVEIRKIHKLSEKNHSLGIFIRSLVRSTRDAAKQVFSDFINGTTAPPNQIEFIDLVEQCLPKTV